MIDIERCSAATYATNIKSQNHVCPLQFWLECSPCILILNFLAWQLLTIHKQRFTLYRWCAFWQDTSNSSCESKKRTISSGITEYLKAYNFRWTEISYMKLAVINEIKHARSWTPWQKKNILSFIKFPTIGKAFLISVCKSTEKRLFYCPQGFWMILESTRATCLTYERYSLKDWWTQSVLNPKYNKKTSLITGNVCMVTYVLCRLSSKKCCLQCHQATQTCKCQLFFPASVEIWWFPMWR